LKPQAEACQSHKENAPLVIVPLATLIFVPAAYLLTMPLRVRPRQLVEISIYLGVRDGIYKRATCAHIGIMAADCPPLPIDELRWNVGDMIRAKNRHTPETGFRSNSIEPLKMKSDFCAAFSRPSLG
jgi:hypothetical protein